jgi:hypothetical protein
MKPHTEFVIFEQDLIRYKSKNNIDRNIDA